MLFFESVLFALRSKLSIGLGIVEAFKYETIFYTHVLSLFMENACDFYGSNFSFYIGIF